jgi:hypothetical protein
MQCIKRQQPIYLKPKRNKKKAFCSIYWTRKFPERTHLLSASREDDSTHRKRVEKANPSRDQILHDSLRQLFKTDKRISKNDNKARSS